MNYKLTLRIFSVIFIIIGFIFFGLGPNILTYFGVDYIPEPIIKDGNVIDFWQVYSFTRVFGGAIFMMGVLTGFLAYLEGEKNRRYAAFGSASGLLVLVFVVLTQQIAIWETLAGWILIGVFVIAMIAYALLAFKK